jgi:hypothetical protein
MYPSYVFEKSSEQLKGIGSGVYLGIGLAYITLVDESSNTENIKDVQGVARNRNSNLEKEERETKQMYQGNYIE